MKKNNVLVLLLVVLIIFTGCAKGDVSAKFSEQIIDGKIPVFTDKELDDKRDIISTTEIPRKVEDNVLVNVNVNMGKISGICCRENDYVVVDSENNKLLIFDYDDNLVKEVGRTGNGEVEFLEPVDIAVIDSKVYILDSKNYRVQILDKEFNYIDSVSYYSIVEKYINNLYVISISVDKNGIIYISFLDGDYNKIISYNPETKNFNELGENFYGFLSEYSGTVYALNNRVLVEGSGSTEYSIRTGRNSLFELNDDEMKYICDLHYGITPSGFVKTEKGVYLVSGSYQTIDYYNDQYEYVNSLAFYENITLYSYLALT